MFQCISKLHTKVFEQRHKQTHHIPQQRNNFEKRRLGWFDEAEVHKAERQWDRKCGAGSILRGSTTRNFGFT
jgi:hypothetical protein